MPYAFFDTEIIGTAKPRFFIGVKIGKQHHGFWAHKKGDLERFRELLPKYTWVGFNSENFDRPVIAAALDYWDDPDLKMLANAIITDQMRSWVTYKQFKIPFVEYDHIDLIDVAPGVMVSLKTYAARMGHPTMVDMPFDHTHDLKPSELKTVEEYCFHDLEVTEALFNHLKIEMDLRIEMSEQYGIDLRSKSDAQIAEAILKKSVGIGNKDKFVPSYVTYKAPDWIETSHPAVQEVIDLIQKHKFTINKGNGSPEVPELLKQPVRINNGFYQMGVGGLHSTHDQTMCLMADEELVLSDFDVASYYPNIMMKCGLVPKLAAGKGVKFLEEYRKIYEQRMAAKRSGNKKVANSLKITLNGTFGKLGSIYCAFYSPDLLLATTITGQLNLLCLIHELEKIKHVTVKSANTDGVLVAYHPAARDKVLKVFERNSKKTGFEYEETQYLTYAAKDVNNYIAVKRGYDKEKGWLDTPDGVKRKGLYAVAGVQEMKNPTFEVCSDAAAAFLEKGILPEDYIKAAKDIKDFVAVRNVKGGGVQHLQFKEVDDWEEIADRTWAYPGMTTKPVKRVSRPPARVVGVGGKPFGRVARWYMTTESLPAITYVGTGNQVPKTEGGKLLLTLTRSIPKDIDRKWYVEETYRILQDLGVNIR